MSKTHINQSTDFLLTQKKEKEVKKLKNSSALIDYSLTIQSSEKKLG